MISLKKIYSNLLTILYLLTIFLLFIDSYRSRSTTLTYLHIDSRDIAISAIIILIVLRIFSQFSLIPAVTKLNTYIILPFTIVLSVILTVWDYFTHANYVFSITQIQYTQLFFIGIFSLIIGLINHTNVWFSKNYKKIIFISSVCYLFFAFVVSLFPRDVFAKLSKEDRLIENVQFFVLLFGAFWAFKFARILFNKKNHVNAIIFFIVTIAFIFVAGDEISWGQRIFHIETPHTVALINDQKETTVHNLHFFSGLVRTLYILIGFYGAIAWILQAFFNQLKKEPFKYYIPPWFCTIFYFTGFAYNFFADFVREFSLYLWAESSELMLYSGMTLTMLALVMRYKKNKV